MIPSNPFVVETECGLCVEYVDHMGDDFRVCDGARVSFARRSEDFDVERNYNLIDRLGNEGHLSPFMHPHVSLRLKLPIYLARQYVKHSVGAVWNEKSGRYTKTFDSFYYSPRLTDYQKYAMKRVCEENLETYKGLLVANVPKELARSVLPLNTFTEVFVTGSLAYWARVVNQRLDEHAQYEAQLLAHLIDQVMRELYPYAWEVLAK